MPPNSRPRAAERELRRDETVLTAHVLRGLTRLVIDTLDMLLLEPGNHVDVSALHDRLSAVLDASMQHHVRLQDRWRRRKTRATSASSTIPASARPFRRAGAYLGSFSSLREAAAHLVDPAIHTQSPEARPDDIGTYLDAHLQGYLWTISAGGQVHAFSPTRREPKRHT